MLAREPKFSTVAVNLNAWFEEQLQGKASGVLVSHNTATDIQYLLCEYLRCGVALPAKIKLGLDTLKTLNRFSSVCYRQVPVEDWSEVTSKGKASMGVKPCAVYALSKREPPQRFEDICGDHHDADADTRAVAVILFDQSTFGQRSLYNTIFCGGRRCFQPLETIWSAMRDKMKEPVLDMEPIPVPWIPARV